MENSAEAIRLDAVRFQKHVETLTSSQRQFVVLLQDWIRKPRNMVVVVSGGPGTGKTYAVVESLNFVLCKQLRMAPTARIAEKIGGRTIHSGLRIDWKQGSVLAELEKKFNREDDSLSIIEDSDVLQGEMQMDDRFPIVVVDEIGMVPFWFSIQVINFMFEKSDGGTLIVVMGDKHQLKPVKSSENLFDIYTYLQSRFETHIIDLTESKRFDPDYEPIVRKLCNFVDGGDETGLLTYVCHTFPVVDRIDADILKRCTRAMAFRNATVDAYNDFYLKEMVNGPVVRLFQYRHGKLMKNNYIDVKEGCLIFVTQNSCSYEAKNGTCCTFVRYDHDKDCVEGIKTTDGSTCRIYRNFQGKFPIVLGFAGTVHKFQGETIDDENIAINFDENRDLNLMYTALSRVKSMNQIRAIVLGKIRQEEEEE